MDKILEKAKELKKEINDIPEVKEYLRLKELVENNEELNEIRLKMKNLSRKSQEYLELEKAYLSHPLMVNYLYVKEEMIKVLGNIKEIIDL